MSKQQKVETDIVDKAYAACNEDASLDELSTIKASLAEEGVSVEAELAASPDRRNQIINAHETMAIIAENDAREAARALALTTRLRRIGVVQNQLAEKITLRRADDAEKKRQAKYAEASALSEALGKEYHDIIEAAATALRQQRARLQAAESLIAEANSDLPRGAKPVPHVDQDRYPVPLPWGEKVMSRVQLWTHLEGGGLVTPSEARHINERGVFVLPGALKRVGGDIREFVKRDFDRTETFRYRAERHYGVPFPASEPSARPSRSSTRRW